MQQREQIFQSIEQKCRDLLERYDQLIVREIEQKYNGKLRLNPDSDHILDLLDSPLRNDVLELLKKHNFQKPELLFGLIANLCKHDIYEEGMYIYLLSQFVDLKNYSKKDTVHTVDANIGKLVFYKFTEFIDDQTVIDLVNSGQCSNKCHTVVGAFYDKIEDANIVTSLMPGRYGGQYFHSYFTTDEDLVIDISNNGIFDKEGFDLYFKPQEVITYPAIELPKRYEAIKEKNTDAKALQIALEHMKRR